MAEVAQIKISQLCECLEQRVLWGDVEQAIRTSDHVSVTKSLWTETWWQRGVLLRKNDFKHKIIQLFASHCLKKTHSNKRMGHKSLFRHNFFLNCLESFDCSWNLFVPYLVLAHLPSRGIENMLIRDGKVNLFFHSFMKYLLSELHYHSCFRFKQGGGRAFSEWLSCILAICHDGCLPPSKTRMWPTNIWISQTPEIC